MKRSGFKRKIGKGLKRSGFSKKDLVTGVLNEKNVYPLLKMLNKFKPETETVIVVPKTLYKSLRRTKLRVVGHSSAKELKDEIQALLREIAIIRDGGCFLRLFKDRITPQYLECGGWRKDGGLILQFEHLNPRNRAISFSDPRLGVCACLRHHFYYKKQYPAEYEIFAREFIGKERTALLDRVRLDFKSYKVDLKMEIIGLKHELAKIKKEQILANNIG